jgi:O-antigen/teichoic acid export membrane protein
MDSLRAWWGRLRTPVVRNAMYLIATEVVGAVLGLAFWSVAARLFPDDTILGLGAVLITGATLVAILSTLGFNISLVRFLPEPSAPVVRLINSSVTIASAVAVVLAVAFGLGAGQFLPALAFLSGNPALLALFAFFTVVWTVSLLFDAAFIGLGQARFVLLRAAIYNLLKVPLPLALVVVLSEPFALFSAWGVGLLVANLVAAVFLLARVVPAYRLRPDLDRAAVGSMVRYSFASHATNVLGAVPGLVFPLLVARVFSPSTKEAAYFYIAWMLANLLFVIPGSIFTSVFAEGSRWRPGLKGNALDGLFLSIGVLVPGVGATLLAGPWVLAALKPSFAAAVPLLDVLAVSSFFVAINALYIAVRRVEKRVRSVLLIYLGATLGALALAWPLMAVAGLAGAGLAFGLAQAAVAAFALLSLFREGAFRRGP